MLGTLFGQFVGGVLWGVGASLASSVVREGGSDSLRDITRLAVKTYLTAADRVQETAEEIRHNIDEVVAEAEAERAAEAARPAA